MKEEMDVQGSPSLTVLPYGLCGRKATLKKKQASEFMSCVKETVDVLGSPSLTVRTVSVDVKQH